MKFKVDRNRLLEAMQKASQAITGKSSRLLSEICRSFVFKARNESLTVMATDGDIFISTWVSIENTDGDKDFALYAPQFLKAIKSVDPQELTIEVLEYQVIVTHEVGSFALPLTDMSQVCYPEADSKTVLDYSRIHRHTFEAPGLLSILNKCKYAMAEDELRPVMNGVVMSLKETHTDFVASDGHKLVRIRKASITDSRPADFIFPKKVVNILLKILPKTGFVDTWFNEYAVDWKSEEHPGEQTPKSGCLMSVEGTEILFKPIPGRYPNYNNVIPTTFTKELIIDRKQLLKSLQRLSQFTAESGLIRWNLNPTRLMLQAEDTDFSVNGSETLPCTYKDEVCRLGFKDYSFVQTLQNSTAPEIVMKGSGTTTAFIIEPIPQPDNEEVTMLLMPMLISD